MTHAAITGVGAFLPERIVTNDDLATMVETSDEWIRTRTGIRERRFVSEGETTSDLGAGAALAALADAGLEPSDIDLLVVGTSSPDMIMPSTACLVQAKIGLTCPAFDVMAACTSFIYAIHTATTAIESGRARRVLVIGADALTRLVDFSDRRTCVLFGDGAGAFVLEASEGPGVLGIDLGSDGSRPEVLQVAAGGATMPASIQTVEDGLHFLSMNGQEVFKFAVRTIPATTKKALAASDLSIDDLTWLIPHQANQRILDTVADRLKLPHERVFSNIELLGNTSAASIPLAVNDLYTSGNLRQGDVLALVGFGAGLTWGAAIVRWTKEDL
ncbi:MAG: 3-oxoacyl-ACP synthase [Actinobacteria bacterium HGW-Actinobacteria-6]|nr:MAG: 3-oxoacyl-ACP synthase [Actinobacteria bacterium HGW-Actinobacteria-6]